MKNKFKNWVLDVFFAEEIKNLYDNAVIAGSKDAFKKAHADIMETRVDDIEERAKELVDEKLARMLSVVDLNKIVTVDKNRGMVFVGGVRVEEGRLASLKAEAEYFSRSDLWALLYETPKELAQKSMFVSGESLADMQKGKSILYTLSAQSNILGVFISYQQPKK